jgi:hypothetical protein
MMGYFDSVLYYCKLNSGPIQESDLILDIDNNFHKIIHFIQAFQRKESQHDYEMIPSLVNLQRAYSLTHPPYIASIPMHSLALTTDSFSNILQKCVEMRYH